MARTCVVLATLLYFVQCDVNSVQPTPDIFEPTWVYKCEPEEGCQRLNHPDRGSNHVFWNSTIHYESLSVCRTVCGRFGGLWPRPVSAAISTQLVRIHPNNLRFSLDDTPAETRELLVKMTRVVSDNLLAECYGNVTESVDTPMVVYITVKKEDTELTWDTNEEYLLDVQKRDGKISVHVVAETVFGARHGLETFTQLVSSDIPDYSENYICSLNIVTGAKIKDQPAYKHRGFVLDTSRNFIPIVNIRKMMDGMAATKMNVFHWHVTDSHSFPLESSRVPQFTRYGAYSAMEIYSAEEVQDLVEYAKVRGIRVVIEIDAPAHAGNGWQWGKDYGLGDLAVCVNEKNWRKYCIQPPCGQLNPANPQVYTVLRSLYKDIADLIPQPALFHMGGDEVFISCWNHTEEIVNYMQSKGMNLDVEGFIDLWGQFHKTALNVWDEVLATGHKQASKQPVMIWSSELTQAHRIRKHLDADRFIIEVWEPLESSLLNDLLRLGYRTVTVPKNVWYLDHGFYGSTRYSNWRRMYSYLLPNNPNVLGGEVAMWSEYVDAEGLDTRVWPRAAAVAERLWSNPQSGVNSAEPRLQRFRERLINRGIRADVLSPRWCAQHDAKCR